MPYTKDNPPAATKGLPDHALTIFLAAFNSSLASTKDEKKAFPIAWAAVGQHYEKDKDGQWVMKPGHEYKAGKWLVNGKESAVDEAILSFLAEAGARHAAWEIQLIQKVIGDLGRLLDQQKAENADQKESEVLAAVVAGFTELAEQMGMSYDERTSLVRAALDKRFPVDNTASSPDWHWMEQCYDDHAIYSKGGKKYSIPYMLNGDQVTLGDPQEVKIEYVPVAAKESENPGIPTDDESQIVLESGAATEVEVREFNTVIVAEAGPDGVKQPVITVIQPGWNTSKQRYYRRSTLQRDHGIFKGAKMFIDHPTESEAASRPERSLKDWVSTVKETWVDPATGQIKGRAKIVRPEFGEFLQEAAEDIGVSIHALCKVQKGQFTPTRVGTISALHDLLDELGPEASEAVRNGLISGVALGKNSNDLARQIRAALGMNMVRALTISTTEAMRSGREPSHQTYPANSDVVKGWIWHSALGPRTCAAC